MDTAKVKQLIDRLSDHLDVETNSYAEDLIESLRKEVLPAPVNVNPGQPLAGDKPGEFGEPWVFSRTFEILVDSRGLLITQIHNGFGGEMICDHQACGDGRIQMRRIVACVNACRGIPTEELERYGRGAVFKQAAKEMGPKIRGIAERMAAEAAKKFAEDGQLPDGLRGLEHFLDDE